MVVMIPFIINGIFNVLILLKVVASTRRIHDQGAHLNQTENVRQYHARDIHLLKHMLFIFLIFIGGWAPVYTAVVLHLFIDISVWILVSLQIPPIFSSLIIVLDLYVYNHDLRRYIKRRILRREVDPTIINGTQHDFQMSQSVRK